MRRTIGVVFVALLWAGGMFLVVVWLLNYLDGTRQSNWLLLVDKMAKRGLQMSDEQMANAAFDDADELFAQPFRWAQEWLAEFGENAKDNYILFAEHWLALFKAWKNAIEKTHRR